jgi:hypothetical protein
MFNAMSEKAEVETVPAVSFFDPALKQVRRRVYYQWCRTCMLRYQSLVNSGEL